MSKAGTPHDSDRTVRTTVEWTRPDGVRFRITHRDKGGREQGHEYMLGVVDGCEQWLDLGLVDPDVARELWRMKHRRPQQRWFKLARWARRLAGWFR